MFKWCKWSTAREMERTISAASVEQNKRWRKYLGHLEVKERPQPVCETKISEMPYCSLTISHCVTHSCHSNCKFSIGSCLVSLLPVSPLVAVWPIHVTHFNMLTHHYWLSRGYHGNWVDSTVACTFRRHWDLARTWTWVFWISAWSDALTRCLIPRPHRRDLAPLGISSGPS